jgi:hypothetical protein
VIDSFIAAVGNRCTVRTACFAFELDHRGMFTSRSRHAPIVFRYYDVRLCLLSVPRVCFLVDASPRDPGWNETQLFRHHLVDLSIFIITRVSYSVNLVPCFPQCYIHFFTSIIP